MISVGHFNLSPISRSFHWPACLIVTMAPQGHYSAASGMNDIKIRLKVMDITEQSESDKANVLINWYKDDRCVEGNFLDKNSENPEFSRDFYT